MGLACLNLLHFWWLHGQRPMWEVHQLNGCVSMVGTVYWCIYMLSTMSVPASTDWRTLRCVIDGRAPEGQGASHATVCVSRGSACLVTGLVYDCWQPVLCCVAARGLRV